MTKLNNWEYNKAISLLQEKYNLLCIENENITDLPNNKPNKNQMQLFSIIFVSDITQVKNEIDEYLKINQLFPVWHANIWPCQPPQHPVSTYSSA
ncbi:38320_t:CDS:2, partial [Gigaspora margarita]